MGRKLPAETSPSSVGETGLIKQIQRQCKTQHRVAEQRDDLADDDENEVLTEAFCFFAWVFPFCYVVRRSVAPLINTDGWYVYL
jgi:hypothetical protein